MDSSQPKPEDQQPPAAEGAPAAGSPPAEKPPEAPQAAPQDALGKTNEELSEQAAAEGTTETPDPGAEPEKKLSPFKKFWRKVNVYALIFLLLVVVAGAIAVVSFLNSQKAPTTPAIATQELTEDALKKLASSDATIGNAAQTLTVQGNAIFSGQVLVRSDLNVAGSIQLGGALLAPSLTVSGKTTLNDTQISSLQVATNALVQGTTTLKDLNVAGASAFSGPVTASQITVTRLILSGNAVLQVPNHLAFTGSSPQRSINSGPLGAGGTASVSGSDTTGTISINTGTGTAPGCFIKLTFNQAFTTSPHVIISPVNSAAGLTQYYVTRTNTGFSLCTNNAAPASEVFAFDYFVTG